MDRQAVVRWRGQDRLIWRAELCVDGGVPCVKSVGYESEGAFTRVAGPLYPRFEATTGVRKPDVRLGKDYENRWNAYGDSPLADPSEVREAEAVFSSEGCTIGHDGNVTFVDFDGLSIGFFSGKTRFSFYEGSNLIRVEAIVSTQEPSLAYIYRAALSGFSAGKLYYRTLRRKMVSELPRGRTGAGKFTRVYARNRVLACAQESGSVAVFPPPHAFFFPRQLEINLAFNFYIKDGGNLTLGIRHNEKNEYYATCPNQRCWPCYNAKPGTEQHMALFLAVSAADEKACRRMVMRYTNGDRYRELPGYKKMANHFHMAFREYWLQDPSVERDWEKLFKEMGVDIAYLNDFHGGDGHTEDTGETRLLELQEYFEACRSHSSDKFLIIPGEEPNNQIDGHWNVFFPRPVNFSRNRDDGQPFSDDTKFGRYYHLGSGDDISAMLEAEGGFMFLPHARTKSSEGCPDVYKDEPFFKKPSFLGIGFRYMPADLSVSRLIDGRNSEVWNDINNWSDHPKYIMGEVDTYEKNIEYDLYGDFNINYVKIGDKLPPPDDFSPIVSALKSGEMFVTTGEVLIRDCRITDGLCEAEIDWTFPMGFAEVVYSDGENVKNEIVSLTKTRPFGKKSLSISFPAGMKWARFAAWDCAGNGAFGQPVFLR